MSKRNGNYQIISTKKSLIKPLPQNVEPFKTTTIFTYGYTEFNDKIGTPGIWGFSFWENGKEIMNTHGIEYGNTTPRLSIIAAINAIRCCLEHDISDFTILTNQTYVSNGVNSWVYGWEKADFKRNGHEIPNSDLWQELYHLKRRFNRVDMRWIQKGSNGRDRRFQNEMDLILKKKI